jgi:protein TonB
VSLSHIIVLFILSNKSPLDNTFSKDLLGRSVIRLTKVYVIADKTNSNKQGFIDEAKQNDNQTESEPQIKQLESGIKEEKTLYITSIKEKIEKAKSYPFVAKRLKLQGIVEVKFEIIESGEIINIVLKNKSGNDIFIKHTLNIFESINSFDPLPVNLRGETFELQLDIVYKI